LIYPTPVIIPLFDAFSEGMSPLVFDAITLPLSLVTLAGILVFFRWWCAEGMQARPKKTEENSLDSGVISGSPGTVHWRAWSPFIAIFVSIPIALFVLNLSHMSMINFIMLIGAGTALVLAQQTARVTGLSQGAKHAGIIIFDICGAGALGFVIVESGFAQAALGQLTLFIPIVLVPFLFAALIETAQGSRVVTAVVSAEVLAGSAVTDAIHPVP
jgi:GntP family gluconate:H+ symporter